MSVCAIVVVVVVVVVVVLITVIMPAKFELLSSWTLAFVLLCFHTFFCALQLFMDFYGWANMLKMKFAYLKVLNKPAHAHTHTLVHTYACSTCAALIVRVREMERERGKAKSIAQFSAPAGSCLCCLPLFYSCCCCTHVFCSLKSPLHPPPSLCLSLKMIPCRFSVCIQNFCT